MSGKSLQGRCNCAGSCADSAATETAGEDLVKLAKAQVPQDYQANFNMRLVPGHSLKNGTELQPHCRPRQHAGGWNLGATAIDPALLATLQAADKTMVAWLAKDTANAQRFLADPVAAMREASVPLTRAEEKALARANAMTASARIVGPGVKVASVAAQAYPNGRVGGIGPSKPDGRPDGKPNGKSDDFGCAPKRKG